MIFTGKIANEVVGDRTHSGGGDDDIDDESVA